MIGYLTPKNSVPGLINFSKLIISPFVKIKFQTQENLQNLSNFSFYTAGNFVT